MAAKSPTGVRGCDPSTRPPTPAGTGCDLSTPEVAELIGVTYRQLGYWCVRYPDLPTASGSGNYLTWTWAEVRTARIIALVASVSGSNAQRPAVDALVCAYVDLGCPKFVALGWHPEVGAFDAIGMTAEEIGTAILVVADLSSLTAGEVAA